MVLGRSDDDAVIENAATSLPLTDTFEEGTEFVFVLPHASGLHHFDHGPDADQARFAQNFDLGRSLDAANIPDDPGPQPTGSTPLETGRTGDTDIRHSSLFQPPVKLRQIFLNEFFDRRSGLLEKR